MKLFSEELLEEARKACNITDLTNATIGETILVVQYIQKKTGIPYMRMDQGSPTLPANVYGIAAEKKALDSGVCGQYPPPDGVPEVKTAAADFIKAFLNVDVSPRCCIPTTGSVAGSFSSFLGCLHRYPNKRKVLLIGPGFPILKSQLRIFGARWKEFDIHDYRGELLRAKLEEELAQGDVSAITYSSPNNPAWICLEESELKIIGELADKYDSVVIEDLAYFCMDYRRDMSHPYQEPYLPTVAHYTDNYILLTSSSKIFSYAGQRMAITCISDKLWEKVYPYMGERYLTTGVFGPTLVASIMYMITSGCTTSTQYAYAEMMRLSVEGKINFLEDVRVYADRAAVMKKIFCDNGFHIVYDRDVTQEIGDGFFFSLGYGDLTSGELVKEMLYYGISSISLSTTGSEQNGVRACTATITEKDFPELEKRAKAFNEDHKTR